MTTRWKDVWAARTLDAGKASMLGSSPPMGLGGILADHDQREGVVLATSGLPGCATSQLPVSNSGSMDHCTGEVLLSWITIVSS